MSQIALILVLASTLLSKMSVKHILRCWLSGRQCKVRERVDEIGKIQPKSVVELPHSQKANGVT